MKLSQTAVQQQAKDNIFFGNAAGASGNHICNSLLNIF